jgi:serine/threonine protein kinase
MSITTYSSSTAEVLVINYLDGTLIETIQRLRNEKNLFTESQVWRILYHVSIGLKFIHAKKYCHRGIRPENILITMDNQFKIYDFSGGTSKAYENLNNNVRICDNPLGT